MKTRVPIETPWSAFDQSPSSLIVMRSHAPLGADEIENGCARHQPSRVRNRHTKYWPERTASWSRSRPGHVDRDDPGRLGDDVRDAQPVAQRQPDRLADAEDEDEADRSTT